MAKRKKIRNSLLTYAVEREAEQEIREYVDATKRRTGLPNLYSSFFSPSR